MLKIGTYLYDNDFIKGYIEEDSTDSDKWTWKKIKVDADGFIYNRSSYYCLCNSSGGNIDSGVEVDLNLVEITNGTRNVSKFFDYKTICEYINSLKK